MQSLNFETGVKELAINGDESRVLKVNTADIGLLDRIDQSLTLLEKTIKEMGADNVEINAEGEAISDFEAVVTIARKTNKEIRNSFDFVFYPGAADIVFGKLNPLAFNASGETLYEAFFEALADVCGDDFKATVNKHEKRIDAYKKAYKSNTPKLPQAVLEGKK